MPPNKPTAKEKTSNNSSGGDGSTPEAPKASRFSQRTRRRRERAQRRMPLPISQKKKYVASISDTNSKGTNKRQKIEGDTGPYGNVNGDENVNDHHDHEGDAGPPDGNNNNGPHVVPNDDTTSISGNESSQGYLSSSQTNKSYKNLYEISKDITKNLRTFFDPGGNGEGFSKRRCLVTKAPIITWKARVIGNLWFAEKPFYQERNRMQNGEESFYNWEGNVVEISQATDVSALGDFHT